MLGMNRYRLRSRTGWNTPLELQLKVHRFLPVRDLKSAVLVNKDWNRVGEDPSLWSRVVVRVRSREDIAKLSAKRLARLREIQIERDANFGTADWELFFQNVEKLAQVENIRGLGYRDLRGVDSSLLARALNGVEHVKLWCTRLTVEQLTSIFNHIQEQDTKIKKLVLAHQDLKAVDSSLLARAVTGLEDVELRYTRLTVEQLTSIFFHILEQDTKIKKMELAYQDLKDVDSGMLARAVNGLEDVKLWCTRLTVQQLTSIFHHIQEQDTKIKKLELAYQDLKDVDSGMLARAVNGLEDVKLRGWGSRMTSHITSIFHHIAEQETKIKKLEICGLNLSGVPSDDLSVAVTKLEVVDFDTKLTTAQVTSIMQHIVEKETKIKILNLRWNHLSDVDENLLNRARDKLFESGGIVYL